MTLALDPRLYAVRPGVADAALRGRVEAERFVEGAARRVTAATSPLRNAPRPDATMLTEALHGESLRVFETTAEGWAWVQLDRDRYVGWAAAGDLAEISHPPTHRVAALRTPVFAGPDIKQPPLLSLPLGAAVAVVGEAADRNARYALIEPAGAIVVQHLCPPGAAEPDFVTVAERFMGVPYLWGGKTNIGLDCSGLVQVALQAAGIEAPRDSDMQEALGAAVAVDENLAGLGRGDLVFWNGHIGIMQDEKRLLHANAHHMAIASEDLRATVARYRAKGLEISTIRRVA